MKPFHELLIVECAGSVAGAYAGKLFANFGATVVKLEPPEGDAARTEGEAWHGIGTLFLYLNTGKRNLRLDTATSMGRRLLGGLLALADVLIESSSPEPLRPLDLVAAPAGLVRVQVSPFGLTGPYAGYRSTPFTDYAAGGHLYLNGESHREPIQGAGRQAEYAAGTYAFIGAMTALLARDSTGQGQAVDVSHMEAMASLHQWTTVKYTHSGTIEHRVGNRYNHTHPITIYPCKDGHVAVSASTDDQTERFLAVSGHAELLDDPRFANGVLRLQHADAFDAAIMPWLLTHTAEEIVSLGQEVRVPVGPVPGTLELLRDPHLAARNFWVNVDHAGGTLLHPGPPFRLSRHTWALTRNDLHGQVVVDAKRWAAVRTASAQTSPASADPVAQGLTDSPRGDGSCHTSHVQGAPDDQDEQSRGAKPGNSPTSQVQAPPGVAKPAGGAAPLAGVRVLDLSRVWAGPIATRILADLGADVIRVEATWSRGHRSMTREVARASGRYPDNEPGARPWNREGMFNKFNRNKRAVTLQLETAAGKAAFEALVRVSDVVLENYSPRVMPQLGLGYERLRELNPGVIYIGMPGFGWTGPARDWVAFGTMIEPAAGLSSLMGYRDGGPYKSGVAWADPVAGLHAAAAVTIALADRAADTEHGGQAIELAQLEGMINFIGEEVLAAQARGADAPRRGNWHPYQAPQGCYPCAGDDRWIALTVTSDKEWRALCHLAGLGEGLAGLRLNERLTARDRLDTALAAWTVEYEHVALMHLLQQHGIAAVAAFDARELVEDPHLAARGFFLTITHPDAGALRFPGQPIHLEQLPSIPTRPAPGLGQHNHEVFGSLLGMSDAAIQALYDAGIAVDEPPE